MFDPALLTPCPVRPELLDDVLLKPMTGFSRAHAASALRSYIYLVTLKTSPIPEPAPGRIDLPLSSLVPHNNIGCRALLPVAARIIQDRAGTRGLLLLFTDRSALVGRHLEDRRFRILPIVLRLVPEISIAGTRWKFSVRAGSTENDTPSGADLHMSPALAQPTTTPTTQPFSCSDPDRIIEQAAAGLLLEEAAAWAEKTESHPAILDPGQSPRAGHVGTDIPAPSAALEGRPYAWPPVMPWRNFDEDRCHAVRASLRLAFIHLLESRRAEDFLHAYAITVKTALPGPDGTAPSKLVIDTKVAPRRRMTGTKEAERRLRDLFSRYLSHPALTDMLRGLQGSVAYFTNDRRDASYLDGITLMRESSQMTPSAHDRIKARALFSHA